MLYFFAIGHAAAFQPRRRFIFTSLARPASRSSRRWPTKTSARTSPRSPASAAVLALLTTIAVHLALERMRSRPPPARAPDRGDGEARHLARPAADAAADRRDGAARARRAVRDRPRRRRTARSRTTVAAGVDPEVADARRTDAPRGAPAAPRGLPVARALRERTSHVVADVAGSTAAAPARRSTTASALTATDEQSRSATVVPMVARGRLLGVIVVRARRARRSAGSCACSRT